jgi:hypothetical protein
MPFGGAGAPSRPRILPYLHIVGEIQAMRKMAWLIRPASLGPPRSRSRIGDWNYERSIDREWRSRSPSLCRLGSTGAFSRRLAAESTRVMGPRPDHEVTHPVPQLADLGHRSIPRHPNGAAGPLRWRLGVRSRWSPTGSPQRRWLLPRCNTALLIAVTLREINAYATNP